MVVGEKLSYCSRPSKNLKGHEESVPDRRPKELGGETEDRNQNWKDRLVVQRKYEGGREPTVSLLGMPCRAKGLKDTTS